MDKVEVYVDLIVGEASVLNELCKSGCLTESDLMTDEWHNDLEVLQERVSDDAQLKPIHFLVTQLAALMEQGADTINGEQREEFLRCTEMLSDRFLVAME